MNNLYSWRNVVLSAILGALLSWVWLGWLDPIANSAPEFSQPLVSDIATTPIQKQTRLKQTIDQTNFPPPRVSALGEPPVFVNDMASEAGEHRADNNDVYGEIYRTSRK